ncbi:MAG: hypothetical protein ACRD44_00400, partial [Bryobacteraceae bacterium]
PVQKLIVKWQRDQEYEEFESRWHHAAIYLGIGLAVVEASRSGVKVVSLLGRLDHNEILVRRHRLSGELGRSILD